LRQVENVMLDARGHVKLVDFGLACALTAEEAPMSPTGSLIYMAPEMLRDAVGGRHTDW
jgi:serine/threonine protein kinase